MNMKFCEKQKHNNQPLPRLTSLCDGLADSQHKLFKCAYLEIWRSSLLAYIILKLSFICKSNYTVYFWESIKVYFGLHKKI